ncbi:MAG: hypothetical protein MK098_00480 [Marinovum sp.]|nr:hypothetical protein [Marinovum sp.]
MTTMARHWPPRFDLKAEATFPALRPVRLARQIRQDMWRLLRDVRGFSPVVQVVAEADETLRVTAGGRIDGVVPSQKNAAIAALLNDAAQRKRWIDWAGQRPQC